MGTKVWHWSVKGLLVVLGVLAGDYASKHNWWIDARYAVTGKMQNVTNKIVDPEPIATIIVLVTDDEYWKGEPAARTPIRRDYLAKLITACAQGYPNVIAVDFDLRSPVADGSLRDNPAYKDETSALVAAINLLKGKTNVVLPTSIVWGKGNDPDREASNVFTGGVGDEVPRGYIQLPYDLRRLPLPQDDILSADQKPNVVVESFSSAIVKVFDITAYNHAIEAGRDSLPFGRYIERKKWDEPNQKEPTVRRMLTASQVLKASPQDLNTWLNGKVVLMGADWHSRSWNFGPGIDDHPSPVGPIPGVYLHANYVESMLAFKTYHALTETKMLIGELVVLALAMLLIASPAPGRVKALAITLGTVGILCTAFFFQVLGMFLDFFIPLVFLLIHIAVEKILEWRSEALSAHPGAHLHAS